MRTGRQIFLRYVRIEPQVRYLIGAELFIQLINTAFLMILNIYMAKKGYADYQIADFISYRFLSVMLLAFPLGLYIKGRKMKPLFYVSAIGVTVFSFLVVHAVAYQADWLLYTCIALWGLSYTFIQVLVLPFILRNTSVKTQTEAISLSYATYSAGMIFSGTIIWFLSSINDTYFDERMTLAILSLLSGAGIICIYRMKGTERIPALEGRRSDVTNFDWAVIFRALIPSFILAVGAGLTIPFINLFFYQVFGLDSDTFSAISAFSAVTVALSALMVPFIRKKYGYRVAVTVTQAIAVAALALMAASEYLSSWTGALYFAVACFLIRQPLMNMAAPVTSELVMNYVGKRNQEMVSALTASIWSGSWFVSAIVFKVLRSAGVPYATIFLITAFLYSLGVIGYYMLIRETEKKKGRQMSQAGNIPEVVNM